MSIPNIEAARPLGLPWRLSLLAIALAATMAANWEGVSVFGFWLFPSGLPSLILGEPPRPTWLAIPFYLSTWFLYILLIFWAFTVQNKRTFLLVFAVLCGVLILNTVGCHTVMDQTEHPRARPVSN